MPYVWAYGLARAAVIALVSKTGTCWDEDMVVVEGEHVIYIQTYNYTCKDNLKSTREMEQNIMCILYSISSVREAVPRCAVHTTVGPKCDGQEFWG